MSNINLTSKKLTAISSEVFLSSAREADALRLAEAFVALQPTLAMRFYEVQRVLGNVFTEVIRDAKPRTEGTLPAVLYKVVIDADKDDLLELEFGFELELNTNLLKVCPYFCCQAHPASTQREAYPGNTGRVSHLVSKEFDINEEFFFAKLQQFAKLDVTPAIDMVLAWLAARDAQVATPSLIHGELLSATLHLI